MFRLALLYFGLGYDYAAEALVDKLRDKLRDPWAAYLQCERDFHEYGRIDLTHFIAVQKDADGIEKPRGIQTTRRCRRRGWPGASASRCGNRSHRYHRPARGEASGPTRKQKTEEVNTTTDGYS